MPLKSNNKESITLAELDKQLSEARRMYTRYNAKSMEACFRVLALEAQREKFLMLTVKENLHDEEIKEA